MCESKLEELRTSLKSGKEVKVEKKYFVSLLTEAAHHQTHPTGGMHGMAQKVHPQVAEKIRELVSEGITDTSSVSRMLRHYVNHHLCQEEKPNPSDRAYYPTKDDIKSHVHQAKQALQLSKLDQKNLELKLPKWKSEHPDSHIFFRPFKLKESANEEKTLKPGCYTGVSTTCESETTEDENSFEDTLLWIHQEKWQQELLTNYGNDISLMDATYKTTKYELLLFFISV